MHRTLASHTARPLRRRSPLRSLALRLTMVERVLGLICAILSERVPQVRR